MDLFPQTFLFDYSEIFLLSQDEKPDSTQSKMDCEPSKKEGKENRSDDKEEHPIKSDADEGSSTDHLGTESVKQEYVEEQESKDNSG